MECLNQLNESAIQAIIVSMIMNNAFILILILFSIDQKKKRATTSINSNNSNSLHINMKREVSPEERKNVIEFMNIKKKLKEEEEEK